MTPSDVMSAAEAAGRLRTLEATITADGDGLWRGDPAVLTGLRAEARALRSVVALHERAAGTWLAGAQATRAADVAALRVIGGSAVYLAGLPLPTPDGNPPAPPQSPLPSPDGGTGPQGDGAPAGGLSVAGAYVDAAGVCEQRAQTQDRLAAASPPGERLSRAWAADELRYVADRIRALAGGP